MHSSLLMWYGPITDFSANVSLCPWHWMNFSCIWTWISIVSMFSFIRSLYWPVYILLINFIISVMIRVVFCQKWLRACTCYDGGSSCLQKSISKRLKYPVKEVLDFQKVLKEIHTYIQCLRNCLNELYSW